MRKRENKENNIVHLRAVVELDDDEKVRKIKWSKKHKRLLIVGGVLMSIAGVALGVYSQLNTYTNIYITTNYEDVTVVNSSCEPFVSGFLKYGKDGVAYINYKGESVWNYAYEIASPVVTVSGDVAVIADSGGNQIVVVDENGVKGEFETYLPIEKVAVSKQGIVAVLMNDGTSPQIICYDAVGNTLIEHKSTLTGLGYPLALALSNDGETMLVTYLQVSESGISSNYAYYSFSDSQQVTEDVIYSGNKTGVAIPEAKYLSDNISVLVGSQSLDIFSGSEEIEQIAQIYLEDEVESVFYGESQIGLILKNPVSDIKELRVYNTSGEVMISVEITGEYESVDIINNQVILYESGSCVIYSLFGIEKYNGEMGMELSGVFPVWGVNKYVVVGDEGMQEVRLTR